MSSALQEDFKQQKGGSELCWKQERRGHSKSGKENREMVTDDTEKVELLKFYSV